MDKDSWTSKRARKNFILKKLNHIEIYGRFGQTEGCCRRFKAHVAPIGGEFNLT